VSLLPRAIVAIDSALDVDAVGGALPEGEAVNVIGVYADIDEARTKLDQVPFDILVIASSGHSERTLLLIDAARKLEPQRTVLVLSEGSSNGYVRRLLESGADDILMLPQSRDQLSFAVKKLMAQRDATAGEGSDRGKLIVVLGPKGGTGKTLTATNLAVALAQTDQSVTLVDIDLQFGDVGLTLGLTPEVTFHDLALSGTRLDALALDHFLMTHESGVRALLAPSRPDQASAVSSELVRDVYSILRATNDFVIVDTPPGFTPEVIVSIDASTDIIMVGMLDSLSLKNTKLGLETLDLMGYESSHVHLVLNRAHSRVGISGSDVVAVLGREPDIAVPSDREIPRAVNEGVPIVLSAPRSEAAAAFRDLASLYTTAPAMASVPAEATRRLFGRRS
jgi:Flp pilus assembly CpaE family ATPase